LDKAFQNTPKLQGVETATEASVGITPNLTAAATIVAFAFLTAIILGMV